MGDILRSTLIFAEAEKEAPLNIITWAFYAILTVVAIFGYLTLAKKGLSQRVFKNTLTQTTEQLYLFLDQMVVGIIGPSGRKYMPMITAFWILIFVSNVIGLFMPETLTAMLPVNIGMAICSIAYVQYEGVKANGLLGHLSHFKGPKMGGALILINVMLFGIEIVSELMKNVSLSLRLYGNIHGGHKAVEAMNDLGLKLLGPTGIPFGALLLPIKVLTCLVQALIFSLLTCVYLSLVTHHGDDHAEHHEEGGTALAAAH